MKHEELDKILLNLCYEIEKLPASEQQTKVITIVSDLLHNLRRSQPELVPLDYKKMFDYWFDFNDGADSSDVKLLKFIYERFGTEPSQDLVIKWPSYYNPQPRHGENIMPEPNSRDLQYQYGYNEALSDCKRAVDKAQKVKG